MESVNWGEEICRQAVRCGFDDCGILPVSALEGFGELLDKRAEDIPHSRFFYDGVGDLRGTAERFPWAKSVVILTFYYGRYRFPKELRGRYAKAFFLEPDGSGGSGYDLGALERWFAGQGIRAEGGARFRHLSVGPLRYMAMKAGLGIIRKNNFFYTRQGSYNTLVGYAIDRECERVRDAQLVPCGETCDLCRRGCRTGALQAPYTMDPLKCVSYWTTFGNCRVPDGLTAEMFEEWVCGCDNCQDACPHNRRHDWDAGEPFSNLEEIAPVILPRNYENLSDEFLVRQVIPKTADHLQASEVSSLRENARRAFRFQKEKE